MFRHAVQARLELISPHVTGHDGLFAQAQLLYEPAFRLMQLTFVAAVSSGWLSMNAASFGFTASRSAANCACVLPEGRPRGAPAHQGALFVCGYKV